MKIEEGKIYEGNDEVKAAIQNFLRDYFMHFWTEESDEEFGCSLNEWIEIFSEEILTVLQLQPEGEPYFLIEMMVSAFPSAWEKVKMLSSSNKNQKEGQYDN